MGESLFSRWRERRAAGESIRAGQNYVTTRKMVAFWLEHGKHAGGDQSHPHVMIRTGTKGSVTNVDKNFVYFSTANMQSVKTQPASREKDVRYIRTGFGFFTTPGEFESAVEQKKKREPDVERALTHERGTESDQIVYGECQNCTMDLVQGRHGYLDCPNECAAQDKAPRKFVNMSAEEQRRTPSGPGGMDLSDVPTVDPEEELSRLVKLKDDGKITPEQFNQKTRRLFGMRAIWMTRRGHDWLAEVLPKAIASYQKDRRMGLPHEKAMEHSTGNWQMVVNMRRQMAGQPDLTEPEIAALRQGVEQAVLEGGQGDVVVAHAMPDQGFIYGRTPSERWLAHLAKKESNPEYEKETERIRENKKKPEAKKRHEFKPAKWTHPNGHPRCLVCGGEEIIGGVCNKEPSTRDIAEFEAELDAEFPGRRDRREKKKAALGAMFERGEITQADMDQEMEREALVELSETLLDMFAQGRITQTDMDQRLSRSRR